MGEKIKSSNKTRTCVNTFQPKNLDLFCDLDLKSSNEEYNDITGEQKKLMASTGFAIANVYQQLLKAHPDMIRASYNELATTMSKASRTLWK